MTNEEITKVEQIREEVRKVLNQMLDEEYEEIIQQIQEGKVKLSNKSITDVIDRLNPPKSNEGEEVNKSSSGAHLE